jgi:hypothetical protein
VTGQYAKLKTPEAQLEYLLLFVCRSRAASSRELAAAPNAVQIPVRQPSSPSRQESRVPGGGRTPLLPGVVRVSRLHPTPIQSLRASDLFGLCSSLEIPLVS